MIKLKLSSKFCPYCSNDKAVDGSYQEIGSFVVMEKCQVFGSTIKPYGEYWECSECGHQEMIWGEKMFMPKEGVKDAD